jgi:hypothetical protein
MGIFARRSQAPPAQSDYTKYRPEVREDFSTCCAYCLLSELVAHGTENFDLDHFKPKSHPDFSHLAQDFFNLYYACHPCNGYKSNRWPTADLLQRGYRFVDPCTDRFDQHFVSLDDGTWKAKSPAGEYTEAKLRLNRAHLREIRSLLNSIAAERGLPPIDWNMPSQPAIEVLLQG